jgi:hypothetical protein
LKKKMIEEENDSNDPQSQRPFQPHHPFITVKPNPKRRRPCRHRSPSTSFSPSKADFASLASHHDLSQGLSAEFHLAYERCLLQNKAAQLPHLYQIAVTATPTSTPDELRARFSEVIDS